MKKTVLNTALSTAFIVALGFSVSACSGDKEGGSHEVLAVDRVDDAAKLARENAPEAEDMDFPETAPMPVTDGTVTDGTAMDGATEAGATDAVVSDTTDTPTESAGTEAAIAGTDSTETPAATEAEPATN